MTFCTPRRSSILELCAYTTRGTEARLLTLSLHLLTCGRSALVPALPHRSHLCSLFPPGHGGGAGGELPWSPGRCGPCLDPHSYGSANKRGMKETETVNAFLNFPTSFIFVTTMNPTLVFPTPQYKRGEPGPTHL